jgi:hypothetical protein
MATGFAVAVKVVDFATGPLANINRASGVGSGWKPDICTRFLRALSDYYIDDGACFFGAAGEG